MPQLTDNAILVVAHPDDEALWFSAILRRVNQVVICFLDYEPKASFGHARRQILSAYPLQNVSSLDLREAGTFGAVDWRDPRETPYGLEIAYDLIVRERYQSNFDALCDRLQPLVAGFDSVITHNPWGEYGHPDHVQVYRALETLQSDSNFEIWYSNYCGNRSINLALRYITGFECEYISLPTDIEFATQLKALYLDHDCWTWYDDYEWFPEEAYVHDRHGGDRSKAYGKLPLNMIRTEFSQAPANHSKNHRPHILKAIGRRLRRLTRAHRSSK